MKSLLVALLLAQGYQSAPPGIASGKTLLSLPLDTFGATIPDDAGTVSHVVFNPAITNYALQSQTMSSGTSAVSPWTLSSATVTTVAGSPQWAEVTSTVAAGYMDQLVTVPSSTVLAFCATAAKASGTGYAGLSTFKAGNVVTSCACTRSDGGTCTATIVGGGECRGMVSDLGTTPVRLCVFETRTSALTTYNVDFFPGQYGTAVGTTRFTQAQVEVGVITPSVYVPTTTAAASVRPVDTNYALQSGTISTAGAFTAPWLTFAGATVTTVAGAPDGVGSWANVSPVSSSSIAYQPVTIPSSTNATMSVWLRKASGSGKAGIMLGSFVGSSLCTCRRSDGGACRTTGSSTGCNAYIDDLGTTPVRLEVTTNFTADTTIELDLDPGEYGVTTGSPTYYWGAQFEPNRTAASSYIPTLGTAVQVDRSIVDTYATWTPWAMAGTVPQVQATPSPFTPGKAGAGPFSTSNYYSSTGLPTPTDLSACVIFSPASAATQMLVGRDGSVAGTRQWTLSIGSGMGSLNVFKTDGGLTGITASGVSAVLSGPNVICGSYQYVTDGTSVLRLMQNLVNVTAVTTAVGPPQASTAPTEIGRRTYVGSELPFTGTIYETVIWNRALSQAEMTAIQQKVLGHYYNGTPLTVTRASQATILPRLADCASGLPCIFNVPSGVARTEENGLLVESQRTNYALQSGTISTGTAATAPWTLSSATVATVAGDPAGGSWAEVTSTANTGAMQSGTVTVPSSTTFTGSAWMRKASGTGTAGFSIWCGAGTPSTCTCSRSDGGSCAAGTISTNYCRAQVTDLGTTPIRLSGTVTCSGAITGTGLNLYPAEWGVSTGTTRFSLAQLEVGAYPTSYIPTAGTSVQRNADQVSVPNPIATGTQNWCVATTAQPYFGRAWAPASQSAVYAMGSLNGANSMLAYNNSDPGLYLQFKDSLTNNKTVGLYPTNAGSGFVAGMPARIVGCDASGALLLQGGTLAASPGTGTGTGTFTAQPATIYLGSDSGVNYPWNGYLKSFKVCKAKSAKECK